MNIPSDCDSCCIKENAITQPSELNNHRFTLKESSKVLSIVRYRPLCWTGTMVEPDVIQNFTLLDESLQSAIVVKPVSIASSQTEVRGLFRMAHQVGHIPNHPLQRQ